jgi:hypothetical protein
MDLTDRQWQTIWHLMPPVHQGRGRPAQPVFVPQKLNNLHANLGWESYRLTDIQWLILQETFLSLAFLRSNQCLHPPLAGICQYVNVLTCLPTSLCSLFLKFNSPPKMAHIQAYFNMKDFSMRTTLPRKGICSSFFFLFENKCPPFFLVEVAFAKHPRRAASAGRICGAITLCASARSKLIRKS